MPKVRTESSTIRRHRLADFIDSIGHFNRRPCSTCSDNFRVCKGHARSGKCSECLRRGQRCDLMVSISDFARLEKERDKLRKGLQEAYEAQEKARGELGVAFAREMRLRQQIDAIDKRAAEAIGAEWTGIVSDENDHYIQSQAFTDPQPSLCATRQLLPPAIVSTSDVLPTFSWEAFDCYDLNVGSVGELSSCDAGEAS